MPTKCFWMDRTGKGEVALRRYHDPGETHEWTCEGGWHDAANWIDKRVDYTVELRTFNDGDRQPVYAFPLAESVFPAPKHSDKRWPKTCSRCDYEFTEDDKWQVFIEEIYVRADNGEERVLHWSMNPPKVPSAEWGAMWDAPWQQNIRGNPSKPDDGIWLMVRCPSITGRYGNDWAVDMQASGDGYWERKGDPREPETLAISPSIQTGDYHGFLGTNTAPASGWLSDHIG